MLRSIAVTGMSHSVFPTNAQCGRGIQSKIHRRLSPSPFLPPPLPSFLASKCLKRYQTPLPMPRDRRRDGETVWIPANSSLVSTRRVVDGAAPLRPSAVRPPARRRSVGSTCLPCLYCDTCLSLAHSVSV